MVKGVIDIKSLTHFDKTRSEIGGGFENSKTTLASCPTLYLQNDSAVEEDVRKKRVVLQQAAGTFSTQDEPPPFTASIASVSYKVASNVEKASTTEEPGDGCSLQHNVRTPLHKGLQSFTCSGIESRKSIMRVVYLEEVKMIVVLMPISLLTSLFFSPAKTAKAEYQLPAANYLTDLKASG
ncbi:hypothetical protein BDP27DRAFT_1406428 [Rhodocollybia butyracea]|uniref:Uncharacterized protein n=1 Tax=Rhodocollybia butyracea TaxID=206335 RepID=A0A9P5PBJ6_9AGAR|nr:hypothetical protein BDP27DRAFT_1406428 [Rhodocollybia butyracea]